MRFEFATATRILFGPGTINNVIPEAIQLGKRVLLVTGKSPGRAQSLIDQLVAAGLSPVPFSVAHEPTTDIITKGSALAREEHCDCIIGMGGGSVIDTGKAIAAMVSNKGDLFDYLEVIGKGMKLENPAAPSIAIPTTAGTGAEVTKNSVIISPEHRVKVSLRHPSMLPRLAVIDPQLTL